MPRTCIKHPINYLVMSLLLLSGCATFSGKPQPEVSPQVSQAYQRALSSMKAGKDKQAIKQFRQLSKTSPLLSGPHTNLGILYLKLKSVKQAEQSLQKAIELNPENRIAYNYMGIIYRKLGRFDEAEKAYLKAIELDNDYSYAHLNLGILYDLYISDLQKALSHYEKYQSLTDKSDKMVNKWIVDIQRRDTANNKLEANEG